MTFSNVFLIIAVATPLVLVVRDRLRPDLAALLIALTLGLGQLSGLALFGPRDTPEAAVEAFSGFSEPVVLTLLSLFIVTYSLQKSGATSWLARRILRIGGQSERRLIVLYAGASAFLSMFINNLAAGALLLPSAIETCRRTDTRPSKLLIPLAYGSLLGGSATVFSTASLVMNNLLLAANPPLEALSMLDFIRTGGLIVLAGIGFLGLLGPRLLPDRKPPAELMRTRQTVSELEDYYRLSERLWEAVVLPDSPLVGESLEKIGIGESLGLAVAGVRNGGDTVCPPSAEYAIQSDDTLLVVGRRERVQQLTEMGMRIEGQETNNHIDTRDAVMVEAVPAPRSRALGKTIRETDFRSRHGFTVVALCSDGSRCRTDVGDSKLEPGDSLLMIGASEDLKRLHNSPDFIVLEPDTSDQPIDRLQAGLTVGVIAGVVVSSFLGAPVHFSMFAGALLLLTAGMVHMEEAYRAIEWPAIFLVAGMFSVSRAMVHSGLAQGIGQGMVSMMAPFGGLGLAAGAFLLTGVLSQVMGGQVTQLVTGPIMISAAISMGSNPRAMAIATAIGCEASFFLPLGHPVNILVMGPGNYEVQDFVRSGWGLTLLSFLMLMTALLLFWHL